MKRLCLLSTVAVAMVVLSSVGQAADMPAPVYKAPPPPPPPPFSWTGFYLGGNIGAAQVRRDWTDITRGVPFTQGSGSNFMAGGQIGYNWQINSFVLGVEADGDWLSRNNNNGVGIIVPGIAGPIAVTSNSTFLTTVAARFGFAVNRALIYGKAGGGWVGQSNVTVTNLATGASITGTNSGTRSGPMLGVGIEYAITDNWTIKAEYDAVRLSSRNFIVPVGSPFFVGDTFNNGGRNVQEFKVGFNYLFNTGASGAGPRY
jgi:outer membrane immunogenic protein